LRVLFLENDDSYSWNVVDCLRRCGTEVKLVSGRASEAVRAGLREVDAVVVGPGPLDPVRAGLVTAVQDAIAAQLPLLGICLGHQAIGLAFGARLVRTEPAHGVRSSVRFHGSRFLRSFTLETPVMRYHSLALTDLRSPLRCTAETRDGIVMALEHETLPIAGMQFHPDSFATPRGQEMVAAFLREAR
jgi:anthranilate synthase/aminodeoxychorismate synthase-like glutamine amidotransferase